jgi:molybdopterin-synthase adenylyltransferase
MDEKMVNPYLRDGIDVYIESSDKDTTTVIFIFLSTRKRIQLRVSNKLIAALPLFNGDNSIDFILDKAELEKSELVEFLFYLESRNIVSTTNWLEEIDLSHNYKSMVEKQLCFLMDILNSPQEVYALQKRIQRARISIFGIGSTGSWLLVELLQMGFQYFHLFDFKALDKDSVSRHAYFSINNIGEDKVSYYQSIAHEINPSASIISSKQSINIENNVFDKLDDIDLIINCADEPYIGYTSIFLSRYCVQHNKPLFIAGGFDAHLGCLGEMILPRKTPCSDCYNEYFKESLKDWKPLSHPVTNRDKGFGGMAALNVFSASTAALSIIRYYINEEDFLKSSGGRGEFKFDDYQIDAFEVQRNTKCGVCGD